MVGKTGLEPATPSSQNWCSSQLNYFPKCVVFYNTSDYHQPWELVSFTLTSDFHRRSPLVCTQPLWNSHHLITCIFIVPVLCKEFVTPTGLEPVIFTVKGWCPNQLDDSAMSNQCCHRCMATSLICESYQNLLPYWCPISLPGSLMDKHQKVTVTPTRFFLLRPTLCFYPGFQHHCPGTFSLLSYTFPHFVDKLHYNLAGWAQHWPTISNVYTLSVGLWN